MDPLEELAKWLNIEATVNCCATSCERCRKLHAAAAACRELAERHRHGSVRYEVLKPLQDATDAALKRAFAEETDSV